MTDPELIYSVIVILCCANILFGLLQERRKVNEYPSRLLRGVFLSSAASRFMISLLDFVMKDFF